MKTTKRQSVKPEIQLDTRLSGRVSREAYQRLFIAAGMGDETMSEILDRAIKAYCREWALPARITDRSDKSHRVNPAAPVIDSASSPALADAA